MPVETEFAKSLANFEWTNVDQTSPSKPKTCTSLAPKFLDPFSLRLHKSLSFILSHNHSKDDRTSTTEAFGLFSGIFAMTAPGQGWRGPDFKLLSTGISCTCQLFSPAKS